MSEERENYDAGDAPSPEVWTLEKFAVHVRNQCNAIMGAALVNQNRRAAELAEALCTLAADIKHKRTGPLVEPETYDLATLTLEGGPAGAGE